MHMYSNLSYQIKVSGFQLITTTRILVHSMYFSSRLKQANRQVAACKYGTVTSAFSGYVCSVGRGGLIHKLRTALSRGYVYSEMVHVYIRIICIVYFYYTDILKAIL